MENEARARKPWRAHALAKSRTNRTPLRLSQAWSVQKRGTHPVESLAGSSKHELMWLCPCTKLSLT